MNCLVTLFWSAIPYYVTVNFLAWNTRSCYTVVKYQYVCVQTLHQTREHASKLWMLLFSILIGQAGRGRSMTFMITSKTILHNRRIMSHARVLRFSQNAAFASRGSLSACCTAYTKLDCLQSAFSLKIRLVLISAYATCKCLSFVRV